MNKSAACKPRPDCQSVRLCGAGHIFGRDWTAHPVIVRVLIVSLALFSASAMSSPIKLFLVGDVMLARGIDMIQDHSCDPKLYEGNGLDARDYVQLAVMQNGPLPDKAKRGSSYVWGDALKVLDSHAPDVRIINLENSVTENDEPWPLKGIHYRMHPQNVDVVQAAKINCCILANNHTADWGFAGALFLGVVRVCIQLCVCSLSGEWEVFFRVHCPVQSTEPMPQLSLLPSRPAQLCAKRFVSKTSDSTLGPGLNNVCHYFEALSNLVMRCFLFTRFGRIVTEQGWETPVVLFSPTFISQSQFVLRFGRDPANASIGERRVRWRRIQFGGGSGSRYVFRLRKGSSARLRHRALVQWGPRSLESQVQPLWCQRDGTTHFDRHCFGGTRSKGQIQRRYCGAIHPLGWELGI